MSDIDLTDLLELEVNSSLGLGLDWAMSAPEFMLPKSPDGIDVGGKPSPGWLPGVPGGGGMPPLTPDEGIGGPPGGGGPTPIGGGGGGGPLPGGPFIGPMGSG